MVKKITKSLEKEIRDRELLFKRFSTIDAWLLDGSIELAILAYNTKNNLIGWACATSKFDAGEVEIGVFVNRRYRHKGLGKSLMKGLAELCHKDDRFETLPIVYSDRKQDYKKISVYKKH